MFAIIKTGGKQYIVSQDQTITVEKLEGEQGGVITFDDVLLVGDGKDVKIGTPNVDGASVKGEILAQKRDKKKIVFRYHPKTRYRKKKGHRQPLTDVKIVAINA